MATLYPADPLAGDVVELTTEDPFAQHPALSTPVRLFPHQLTLVHRLLNVEGSSISVASMNAATALSRTFPAGYDFRIRSRIGIIADKVGAGKSYSILALVLIDHQRRQQQQQQVEEAPAAPPDHSERMTRAYCENRLTISCGIATVPHTSGITVIVVPHALVRQWVGYAEQFLGGEMRVASVHRSRHIPIDLEAVDVLIVSTTFHNVVARALRSQVVRRVVYDEADSLHIPGCLTIASTFHWFATASFRNLLNPSGSRSTAGVRSTGFIRNTFHELSLSPTARILAQAVVFKNTDAYVDASLQVPPVVNHVLCCRSPIAVRVLNGMVDQVVLECLNAGDVASAIQHMSPANRQSEDNIIDTLLERLSARRHNLQVQLEQLPSLIMDAHTEQAEEARLRAKIKTATDHMQSIQDRIRESDMCCVCYSSFNNKTIVPCCSNAFCFSCISRWTSMKHNCPLCKATLATSDVLIVAAASDASTSEGGADVPPPAPQQLSKMEQLERILSERLGGERQQPSSARILLFSGFDNTFNGVVPVLERLGVSYRYLKGNQDITAKILRDYRDGSVNVLFVNPSNYGSGLNCENTTDVILMHRFNHEIEHQVIGRAQRLGRVDPLNVWYLLHENEIANSAPGGAANNPP